MGTGYNIGVNVDLCTLLFALVCEDVKVHNILATKLVSANRSAIKYQKMWAPHARPTNPTVQVDCAHWVNHQFSCG